MRRLLLSPLSLPVSLAFSGPQGNYAGAMCVCVCVRACVFVCVCVVHMCAFEKETTIERSGGLSKEETSKQV